MELGATHRLGVSAGATMSGGAACRCEPRRLVVVQRNCNYSAFSGYRRTYSAYSLVRCTTCSTTWRTAAKYVDALPDEKPT